MKQFIMIVGCTILLSGCSQKGQNQPAPTITANGDSGQNPAAGTPIVQATGLVLQCLKCVFVEEQGVRYVAGQIHNNAKLPVTGYAMAIDLQDGKGQSVKKIGGLMLMTAIPLEAGATKAFKQQVLSDEAGVTQAVIYLKKAGTDERLSNPLTLKLNAGADLPAAESKPAKKS